MHDNEGGYTLPKKTGILATSGEIKITDALGNVPLTLRASGILPITQGTDFRIFGIYSFRQKGKRKGTKIEAKMSFKRKIFYTFEF